MDFQNANRYNKPHRPSWAFGHHSFCSPIQILFIFLTKELGIFILANFFLREITLALCLGFAYVILISPSLLRHTWVLDSWSVWNQTSWVGISIQHHHFFSSWMQLVIWFLFKCWGRLLKRFFHFITESTIFPPLSLESMEWSKSTCTLSFFQFEHRNCLGIPGLPL